MQHHVSVLLFVALVCGSVMLLFTRLFGAATLAGNENEELSNCVLFWIIIIPYFRANPMIDEFAIFAICSFYWAEECTYSPSS